MSPPSQIFLFFALFFVGLADDLQILLSLKSSLGDSNSGVFDSWKTDSIAGACDFAGITCDSDGFVTEIEFANRNLSGSFPFDSVCELQNLRKLSLGFNSFSGIIPKHLDSCRNLQYLDIGNNLFSDSFPEFPSLNQLQYLYLNRSGISGKFPWKSLRNATNLVVLSIGDNPFDMTPFPEEILSLNKLWWLYMSNCSITGKIHPMIGNLTELYNLEISDNSLTGEIPLEIGKLTKLRQFEVYNNSLTGKLHRGFRNLTNLRNFDASTNFLEGDLSELRFSTKLESLQLFENNLSGEIPAEFGKFKELVNLSLYTNKLTGHIPQELGSWSNFIFIDVSENSLTGTIPPNMCKRGTMEALLMLHNRFTGSIPEAYGNCSTLQRFRVSSNSLTGKVPGGLWGLPKLEIIDIAMNQIEGPISVSIKNAKTLGKLLLGFNKLSDELPEEIDGAESLVAAELNNNRFSGKIPNSIGNLKRLSSLKLQSNVFSGSIPDSIGSCAALSDLNIADNSLIGEIPASLGSLTINSLNLSNNKLSGMIPESLSSLKLSLLDLSNNRLSGEIPHSLSIDAYTDSFNGNPGLCSTMIKSLNRCSKSSGSHREAHVLVLCLVFGLLILVASLVFILFLRKQESNHDLVLKHGSWSLKSFRAVNFTEDKIIDSIKDENLIGKGGCGEVYRVILDDGREFAVKHIQHNKDNNSHVRIRSSTPILEERSGKSKEFEREVQTLSSIRHVNIVKLYCSITSQDSSLLVYEYLPNGSLWDMLHTYEKSELGWETRYEIALGAAKGLEYLHHGYDRPIIHRDVKSSNILLDEFLKPRIADFGLAKIIQADKSHLDSTHVVAGTYGYIAPEYGYTSKVDEKSDVYSFGVVLMELVIGKRPIDAEYGENKDIVKWVSENVKSKERVMEMVDKRIRERYREDAIKVLRIGIHCTARLPGLRPTMRSVVHMIEDARPNTLLGIVINKDDALDVKLKDVHC